MRRVEVLDGTIVYNGKSYSKGDILEIDTKVANTISHLLKDVKEPVVKAPKVNAVKNEPVEKLTSEVDVKEPVAEAPAPAVNPFANSNKNKSKNKNRNKNRK